MQPFVKLDISSSCRALTQTVQVQNASLQVRLEVSDLLRSMVDFVVDTDSVGALEFERESCRKVDLFSQLLLGKIYSLQSENKRLFEEVESSRNRAKEVRDKFIVEVGPFLSQNKEASKLAHRIKELELRLAHARSEPEEKEENIQSTSPTAKEAESQDQRDLESQVVLLKAEQRQFLFDLEEKLLLEMFSFLETVEVLSAAQVCRFVYKRVDTMFGIDSAIVKPEWGVRDVPRIVEQANRDAVEAHSTLQDSDSNPVKSTGVAMRSGANDHLEVKLTRELLGELTKKLTGAELKVIISIAEKMKKQSAELETINAERDDLTVRLQVFILHCSSTYINEARSSERRISQRFPRR